MRSGPEQPLCMTPREVELWWEADRRAWKIGGKPDLRASPCDDCNREFAQDMRAVGRCNGLYPGEEPEPMPSSLRHHGYASDEERLAARRASYRRAGRRYRALRAMP